MFKNSDNGLAKIAVEKSLLKEYNVSGQRAVYMDSNTEFQIQLYNDQKDDISVKVYINNKPMKSMLVLRPAERCWLERYTDRAVKFKFSTYTVDGNEETKEITADNGVIKVEFFRRVRRREPIHTYFDTWYDSALGTWNKAGGYGYSTTTPFGGHVSVNYSSYSSTSNLSSLSTANSKEASCSSITDGAVWPGKFKDSCIKKSAPKVKADLVETGRIEEGGSSSQEFETTCMDFEYSPFKTEIIKILPKSTKPVQPSDLQKTYCPECGRKLNNKYKFCPYCGTKLDEADSATE